MKRKILMGLAFLLTLGAIAIAQVPGVNSPFQMVFTYTFDRATNKATYIATTGTPITLASSAQVFFQINGSATKLIRIRRVILSGYTPSAAVAEPIYFNRVGAMPSTGTSAVLTGALLDSTNTAATAVVESFTANPTDPTLTSEIMNPYVRFVPSATANPSQEFIFGEGGSALMLRGTTEGLSLNLARVTTASFVSVQIEWTEE